MATIDTYTTQAGVRMYRVRVRRKGHPESVATFQKLSDAKKYATMREGQIIEGRHLPKQAKKYTVHEMLERYKTDVSPSKRRSTIYNQVYHLQWWEDQIGSLFLTDITPSKIIACRDHLGKTRGGATVNRYLALLSHAFSLAIQWEWCEDNPVRRISKMKEPAGRIRYLSDEERYRLLEECQKSRNTSLYTIVVLALSTGARMRRVIVITEVGCRPETRDAHVS